MIIDCTTFFVLLQKIRKTYLLSGCLVVLLMVFDSIAMSNS